MNPDDLSPAELKALADSAVRLFASPAAWAAHLERLGIAGFDGSLAPARVATEGALWGSIAAHGYLRQAVIVSDDAGQFDAGSHALCWVHAERLVHRLDTFTDPQRAAQQHLRALIWRFYADLKAYRADPSRRRRSDLRARFERIFRRPTGFARLDLAAPVALIGLARREAQRHIGRRRRRVLAPPPARRIAPHRVVAALIAEPA